MVAALLYYYDCAILTHFGSITVIIKRITIVLAELLHELVLKAAFLV